MVQRRGRQPLKSFWTNTRRYMNKNKAINWKANEGVFQHKDKKSIIGRLIGLHHLFHQCTCHGLHIQVYLIHGLGTVLGWLVMIINILLMPHHGAMANMISRHARVKISDMLNVCKAEIAC